MEDTDLHVGQPARFFYRESCSRDWGLSPFCGGNYSGGAPNGAPSG
ncbi:MAG TPA: hypothetical protein VN877_07560 [Opitutaceae bacterium]|nr:hypothetical protein [Opitutaceae bacterium]